MCGLNGIFAYYDGQNAPAREELIATRDHMLTRGPDGSGEWWSKEGRIGLGHRRLSIMDLSDRALQPMASVDGRFQVVFNGEIYNFPKLKQTLEADGVRFRTSSDTEVLLHLYDRHGEAMVHHLRGMFAFAIWDNKTRSLFLARDPYGIKPLYTSNDGRTFRFASQVKALLAGGRVSLDPEPAGIVGFHLWGSVPEPFTLYRDIQCLPAGHTQLVDAAGPRLPKQYASIAAEFAKLDDRNSDAFDRVRNAAAESVAAHLLADVEVGVFLSAGIDSGALLGLMRDAGQTRIRAITLAFDDYLGTSQDEAPLAAQVAQRYDAQHIIKRVDRSEFESDLPAIVAAMDQPSIDGINTWFVAKAAREAGLKVAISGVGGDELFAGYPSFADIPRWVPWLRVPGAIPGFGVALRRMGEALQLGKANPKILGLAEYGGSYPGAYMLRRGLFLPFELETLLDPGMVRDGLRRLRPLELLKNSALSPEPNAPLSRVAALESTCYLRNQLLRDSDWAGMAHSLEIRTPLVDFDLLKTIGPLTSRMQRGYGKAALASAPTKALPASIVARAKTGFGVPIDNWIGALTLEKAVLTKGQVSRAWARDILCRFSQVKHWAKSAVISQINTDEAKSRRRLPTDR